MSITLPPCAALLIPATTGNISGAKIAVPIMAKEPNGLDINPFMVFSAKPNKPPPLPLVPRILLMVSKMLIYIVLLSFSIYRIITR